MPKLAPAPAQPIDIVSPERRQESQVLPQSSNIEARVPTTDRLDERRSILQRLNSKLDDTSASRQPQQPSALTTDTSSSEKRASPTMAEQRRTDSPQAASLVAAPASSPEQKTPSLFATLKNKLLNVVGLGESTSKSEHAVGQRTEETPGLFARIKNHLSKLGEIKTLSNLVSWGRDFACAVFPSLSSWIKPLPPIAITTTALAAQSTPATESPVTYQGATQFLRHRSDDDIIWTRQTRGADLTTKALETVAEATRAQTIQEDKKKDVQQDLKDRDKAKLRAALTKIATEGANTGDLSAIIAEFEGVYGSAEVAIRLANELAAKRKMS
jgi:hypothetical protein